MIGQQTAWEGLIESSAFIVHQRPKRRCASSYLQGNEHQYVTALEIAPLYHLGQQ
jgi:hypothetical protein